METEDIINIAGEPAFGRDFLVYPSPLTNVFVFLPNWDENQTKKYWCFHNTWIPVL